MSRTEGTFIEYGKKEKGNRPICQKMLIGFLLAICILWGASTHPEAAALKAGKTYTYEGIKEKGVSRVYYITTPKKGYIRFYLTNMQAYDDGEPARATAYAAIKRASDGKEYEVISAEDGEGAKSSHYYTLPSNTKLKIEITMSSLFDFADSLRYSLRIKTKLPKRFETGRNHLKRKATKLTAKKVYQGIMMKDETDWYYFKAPKAGYYKAFVAATKGEYSYNSLNVTPYQGYVQVTSTRCYVGNGYQYVLGRRLKKGQKVFFKLADGDYDTFYKIKVKRAGKY